ncbi:MAG: hypothetical protein WA056_10055 [Gallionella sp.]
MSKLKSEINKAAHYLAQASEVQIRYALEAKCRELLKDGKSPQQVLMYLHKTVSEGALGIDALVSKIKESCSLTNHLKQEGENN